MRKILMVCLIMILVLSIAEADFVVALKKSDKVDANVVKKLASEEKVNVIIKLKEQIKNNQDDVIDSISSGKFKLKHKYKRMNYLAAEIDAKALAELKNSPEVERIYEDKIIEAMLAESIPLIGADTVHSSGYTGDGFNVCIVDTGVDYNHDALAGKVVAQKCYCCDDASGK